MSEQSTPGRTARGPLRRDRRSKVVAGVCGGLGRHLDIDPVVFRILFFVFSFVGGLGLLAYAAAWLFMPLEGAEKSAAHRMLTGSNPLLAIVVAIGLGIGALASISAFTRGVTNIWPLWLLAAAVLGVLVWRGDIKLGGRSETVRAPEQAPTWWQQPVAAPSAQAATETSEPQDAAPPEYEPYTAAGPSPFGAASSSPEPAGTSAAQRPRRRAFGGLVLASLLAATGVLGVLDAAGAVSLTWLSGGALVLLLLGAGMVVGGLFGRTTALVPVGIVLAVPLIALSAIGVPLHGTVGNEVWQPASATRMPMAYQNGIGDATLDLTSVVPGAGKTVTVTVDVGVGNLRVQLPPNVDAIVHASDGIGEIAQNGVPMAHRGIAQNPTFEVTPVLIPQSKVQGTIVLDLKTGIGDMEVAQ